MKNFIKKILLLAALTIIGLGLFVFFPCYYIDTFNIFHIFDLRFTSAEPNKNFTKTKYILSDKEKFNAFLLGSSKVGYLPDDYLPKEMDGKALNWYNMTYSEGVPKENYLTLKTFIENGIDVKAAVVTFDSIAMYATYEEHAQQFLRIPYQEYEKDPFAYYAKYLYTFPDITIINQVLSYSKEKNKDVKETYYTKGTSISLYDITIDESAPVDLAKYNSAPIKYTAKDAYKDIIDLKNFCDENNIKLTLATNPLYITNYKESVAAGYLDFLEKISEHCNFYCFSGLSKYSTDPHYFYEKIHFKVYVGNEMTKVLFGSEEEKLEAQKKAALSKEDEDLFGILVTKDNFKEIKERLLEQYNYPDKFTY